MSIYSTDYPLVWWVKKHLPHRFGQRCRMAGGYTQYQDDRDEHRIWMGEDIELFEFEDGSEEWGPRHCARRPNREWRDALEHRTPECTGQWVTARGGIVCPTCKIWVRKTSESRKALDDSHRGDWAIRHVVRANAWRAVIEAARDGTEPLAFLRLLVAVDPTASFDRDLETAAKEFHVAMRG